MAKRDKGDKTPAPVVNEDADADAASAKKGKAAGAKAVKEALAGMQCARGSATVAGVSCSSVEALTGALVDIYLRASGASVEIGVRGAEVVSSGGAAFNTADALDALADSAEQLATIGIELPAKK